MHPALSQQLITAHIDELERQAAPRRPRPRQRRRLLAPGR
jgi:hypothetical protein